jgi:hypothetical protein
VPSRDSNPGLPYSKPARYYLSHTAPYAIIKKGREQCESLKLPKLSDWGFCQSADNVASSVADPLSLCADPDLDPDNACHFVADPAPTFHFNADPDPSFQIQAINLEKVLK